MFDLAQLIYAGGNWNPRPTAMRRLAWELRKRTSVEPLLEPSQLHPSDSAIFLHPFLYLAGDRGFAPFSDSVVAAMRRHLLYGGMLLVDDASGGEEASFDSSVRREMARIFPDAGFSNLAGDNVLYRTFYLIDRPVGRVAGSGVLEAIERDGRIVVLYTHADLGGALARDNFGNWEHTVVPGGERQREMAFRLGIDIAMYALCLDYKDDQVHLPFLQKRRIFAP